MYMEKMTIDSNFWIFQFISNWLFPHTAVRIYLPVLANCRDCSFVTKTINAENAGAVAVLITDNDTQNDEAQIQMVQDGTEREVQIPSLFLLGKDGYVRPPKGKWRQSLYFFFKYLWFCNFGSDNCKFINKVTKFDNFFLSVQTNPHQWIFGSKNLCKLG